MWTNPPKKSWQGADPPLPPFRAMPGFWVHMAEHPTPKELNWTAFTILAMFLELIPGPCPGTSGMAWHVS